jgi:nitrogen fixation NifU-like protein
MNSDLEDLYQDLIIDHFKHPRCNGKLESADCCQEVNNPLCGDVVELSLKLKDQGIQDLAFSGKGCSISQASASMMAEACKGRSLEQAETLLKDFKAFLQGEEVSADFETNSGDLKALAGVRKFAARTRCALLAWEALKACMKEARSKQYF